MGKEQTVAPCFRRFPACSLGVRVLLGKRKQINLVHAVGMAREREKLLREMKLYQ